MAAVCCTPRLARASDPSALTQRVLDIQDEVADVRGLTFRVDVSVNVETPEQMREQMVREIEEQLDEPTRLGLNLTWKTLGLVPDDFDVAVAYADILEQHVGGYFDVKRERLVLVQRGATLDTPNSMQDMVTAHELVHALQDQHFDLHALTQRELHNDDVGAALQALVEGDASYTMLYRLPVPLDPDRLPMDQLLRAMGSAGGPSDNMGGVLGKSPRVLREPLVFPYIQGLMFAQQVKLSGDGWSALDHAFSAPPLSTEQILHPDKYLGDEPDWPTMLSGDRADKLLGPGWALVSQDTFGELGVSVVIREHLGTTVAPGEGAPGEGWDGDRLWLWQRKSDGQPAMLWVSTWDDEMSAAAYRHDMHQVLRRLYPGAQRPGSTDHDGLGAQRSGRDVVVTLHIPANKARRVRRFARSLDRREVRTLDGVAPKPLDRSADEQ